MFCSIGFETLSSWIYNPRELRRGFANPPNKNIYYFVAQTLTLAHSGLQIRSNVSNPNIHYKKNTADDESAVKTAS